MSYEAPIDPTANASDLRPEARTPDAAPPPPPSRLDLGLAMSHQQPHQPTSSSARPWPLDSARGPLSLFFDPFSEEAAKCKRHLEAQLSKRGAYLPVVSTVAEATHVVLDVDCAASQWLRTGHRDDQHVVSLEWVKDSFLDGASADESLYRVNPGVAGADVVGVSGKGGSGGEQASSGGGSAGEVGEGREGSALVHEEDDTSGSDESREIRSEDEVEINSKAAHRRGITRVRWTEQERKSLAVTLAKNSSSDAAYEEFHRKNPSRTLMAIRRHHLRSRAFFDPAVARIRQRANAAKQNDDAEQDEASSSGSDMDLDDSADFSPLAETSQVVQPRTPALEPEDFRLPGVPPSNLSSPSTEWCYFCGASGSNLNFYWVSDLVASRTIADAGGRETLVYERVASRRGCQGYCYQFYRAGVRGGQQRAGMGEIPDGLGELERLALLTERLLVRGMKRRRDAVEGKSS